jgi:uncharacterized delta-60 repeat protein
MKRPLLCFVIILLFSTVNAQQINGVFTDFAKNNEWGNTVINTATQETSGYITLGGYYEGRTPENKTPMLLQINSAGIIRTDFGGGGVALISSVISSQGSTEIQKTFIANTSSTANNQQFIISGRQAVSEGFASDGFMLKMFGNGTRPTAFNGGNITTYSGGAGSANGYIEDWVTGSFVYSIRLNGATFTQVKVVLSAFSKETGAALASFGENGTLRINPPEGYVVDQARPAKMAVPGTGNHFYVAFSVVPSLGAGDGIALGRINSAGGTIDSSFGTNGYKTFPVSSRYYVTSLLGNNDGSVTIGGYGGDGMESVPSFFTSRPDGSFAVTSFNYLLGEPNPGYGSKNIGAKKATLNGQERIVFAYAHPVNTNDQYRIAIASLSPSSGAGADPLLHTPWLGSEYVSAEPTSIITLSGNAGFIVTGKALRSNGSRAGIVLKYTNNGTPDPAFGSQGVLIINGRTGGNQWSYAAQLPDNKYLAVGGAEFVSGNPSKKAILLNRFNADGSIDSSFGTNGTVYNFQSDYARIGSHILPLPGGEFLVAGSYFSTINEPGTAGGAADNEAVIYKFNADGSPYTSFGPYNNGRYHASGVSFGNMKLIGDHIYVSGGSGIRKLSSGGSYISSYSTGLALIQDYLLNETTGNLYAGGRRNNVTAKQVVKILPSGNIDQSFGNSGYVSVPIISSGDNANLRELKQHPDGSLLAVLHWNNSAVTSYGVFFSSISEAGVLDQSFGTNGAKFLQLPGASNILVARHKWSGQNNDKLLTFGQATVNGVPQGFVCQVDLNGDLDPEFGNAGVIWTTETFAGTLGFDNSGNALAIKDYGFYYGVALAKVSIPADVYNHIGSGSWIGAIDNDWFKPGNWAEGVVPDEYTAVTIASGNVLIGADMHAFAWSIDVAATASLTMGANSTLELTEHNP